MRGIVNLKVYRVLVSFDMYLYIKKFDISLIREGWGGR